MTSLFWDVDQPGGGVNENCVGVNVAAEMWHDVLCHTQLYTLLCETSCKYSYPLYISAYIPVLMLMPIAQALCVFLLLLH